MGSGGFRWVQVCTIGFRLVQHVSIFLCVWSQICMCWQMVSTMFMIPSTIHEHPIISLVHGFRDGDHGFRPRV